MHGLVLLNHYLCSSVQQPSVTGPWVSKQAVFLRQSWPDPGQKISKIGKWGDFVCFLPFIIHLLVQPYGFFTLSWGSLWAQVLRLAEVPADHPVVGPQGHPVSVSLSGNANQSSLSPWVLTQPPCLPQPGVCQKPALLVPGCCHRVPSWWARSGVCSLQPDSLGWDLPSSF